VSQAMTPELEVIMEINITARNLSVSDRFRDYVAERAHKVEQLSHKVQSLEIKVTRHDHSKTSGPEDQVELTVVEPGHVIRAEAHAGDKFSAFDIAFGKLSERLRRAADRRKVHHGAHGSPGTSELTANDFASLDIHAVDADVLLGKSSPAAEDSGPDFGESPVVIRRKEFAGNPMSVDDALYHMELVGHDFYLFLDSETGKPSVVYRRKGWNYGVLTLA
ncbi:MAG: ribosome hibernation-promoting factor, HPF/YfiA family, partial [Rhodoluna sp.]